MNRLQPNFFHYNHQDKPTNSTDTPQSAATPHAPISILYDSGIDAFCAGNGTTGLTLESAHVIESYSFTGIGAGKALKLDSVHRYVILRDLYIQNWEVGVELFNCGNIIITNCTIESCDIGMDLLAPQQINVSSNAFSGNTDSISIYWGLNIDIEKNSFSEFWSNGLEIEAGNYFNIIYNTLVNTTLVNICSAFLKTDWNVLYESSEIIEENVDEIISFLYNVGEGELHDQDCDGLADIYEITNHTDPTAIDTDLDNLHDGFEVLVYGSDPLDSDSDDDGFLDGIEISSGTDPLDVNDYPGKMIGDEDLGLSGWVIWAISASAGIAASVVGILIFKRKKKNGGLPE